MTYLLSKREGEVKSFSKELPHLNIDFNSTVYQSYTASGSNQSNSYQVQDDGNTLFVNLNTWIYFAIPGVRVTSTTKIRFRFRQDILGEIHGLFVSGIDPANHNAAPDFLQRSFLVSGTQTPFTGGNGVLVNDTYSGAGNYQTYEYLLSDYFPINSILDWMGVVNDHDDPPQNGDSYYTNVRFLL